MLAPDQRAALLDALRPAPGERLEAAIATTFTLDLSATLLAPLACAARGVPGGEADPITTLEAVRSTARVVDIFCQAGHINAAPGASGLLAFAEPMIHPVRRPRAGRLFHPKLWLSRYQSAAGSRFRLLCASRNLTDSHSWDAFICLDGSVREHIAPGDKPHGKHLPQANAALAALVRSLPSMAINPLPAARIRRVNDLADGLLDVVWQCPDGVDQVAIHVFGVPGVTAGVDFTGTRHLVISPFCSAEGIARVSPGSARRHVVSRPDELDRLVLPARTTYSVLGDGAGSDESESLGLLHAKAIVIDRPPTSHLFVGSADATEEAFTGNIEVMVELIGAVDTIGVTTVESSLRDVVEPYQPAPEHQVPSLEEGEWQLDEALRVIAETPFTGRVIATDTGYRLIIHTEAIVAVPHGVQLGVELLTRRGEVRWQRSGAPVQASFEGLALSEITGFIVLRALSVDDLRRGAVVLAQVEGDPQERHDHILAYHLDTPDKFLRFAVASVGVAGDERRGGLFELLVRALADRMEHIGDLDRLVRRLDTTPADTSVLPANFGELWRPVREAYHQLSVAGVR